MPNARELAAVWDGMSDPRVRSSWTPGAGVASLLSIDGSDGYRRRSVCPENNDSTTEKPSSRIIRMKPALLAPDRKGLRGIDFKIIQLGVMPLMAKLGVFEPLRGKLRNTVSHVLASEDTE